MPTPPSCHAHAAGFSIDIIVWCHRVDCGTWVEIAPGVWAHAAVPPTWELRIRAGLRWLGPNAALFGHSAAAWWGLDGFEREPVQFVVPRKQRFVPSRMELHTTSVRLRRDQLVHDGLRCTSVTRTIIDLAATGVSARAIEAAIDSGIRARRTSMPTLSKQITRRSSQHAHGVRLLRELLLDSGGESYLERRFLRLMREHNIARPTCQVIHRSGGRTVARVDFQFPGTKLVVEVSGRLGHTSDGDRASDARRRNFLQREGFTVVEFTTALLIDDPAYVVATVTDHLAALVR
ncbi:MAG: DUF559 domain-containing protein [Ilumatobacteraceae bacterium]